MSGARGRQRPKTALSATASPRLVLLTADEELAGLVRQAAQGAWAIEHHRSAHDGSGLFAKPHVQFVLVDDGAVEERERGWLLTQIRKRVPNASLFYVAADHNLENERRARANGARYYTSKPLDLNRFLQVLNSFLTRL